MSNDNDELDSDQGFWGQLDESPETADWAGDDLEEAYLRAMEALEASELQFPDPPAMKSSDDPGDSDPTFEAGTAQPVTGTSDALQAEASAVVASSERIDAATLTGELKELSEKASGEVPAPVRPTAAVTPRQILEALLFVGGEPLTARKLGNVLRGEFSTEFIESLLDDLNVQYSREGRPYEIRLGEGGSCGRSGGG